MADLRQNIVASIAKTQFNGLVNTSQPECAICLMNFTEHCDITPLPCDARHYFHTYCISSWIKQNNICPLCKKEITEKAMMELKYQLNGQQVLVL